METTTRDKSVDAYLEYYGLLPTNFLGELVQGEYIQGFRRRLTKRWKKGELHRPAKQNKYESHRNKFDVYERGGKKKYGTGFEHNLLAALIEANVEIAARKLGLQFISWEQIKAFPETPYQTALSRTPFKLTANWAGEDHIFYPDGHPFKLKGPNGVLSFLFEADRDTEGNRNLTDTQRPYIEAKLYNYFAFSKKPSTDTPTPYKKHFGFDNLIVLFVTTSPAKCVNLQKLLLDITNGRGASNILFKPFPDFLGMDTAVKPDTSFLADPWPRAGHVPFDIVQSLGGRKPAEA
jgi:hypothetical protein